MTSQDLGAAAAFPLHVLREYALVADGERGALVGPRGDFAWLCAPPVGLRRRILLPDRRAGVLRGRPRRNHGSSGAGTTKTAR